MTFGCTDQQFRHEGVLRGADLGDLFHGARIVLSPFDENMSFLIFFNSYRGVAVWQLFATLNLISFSAPIFRSLGIHINNSHSHSCFVFLSVTLCSLVISLALI